jgi:hypothetical protein
MNKNVLANLAAAVAALCAGTSVDKDALAKIRTIQQE